MNTPTVAAAALNQTPLAWETNLANIRQAISDAKAVGASVLCLPEMALCGYGCEDAYWMPNTRAMAAKQLQTLLNDTDATQGLVTCLGLPIEHNGHLFNACVLVADGRVLGIVPKQHLAKDGVHYENRWFTPWPKVCVQTKHFLGQDVPIGDLVFDLSGVRLGFEICQDAWVPDRPIHRMAQRGVDIVLNPSASHFAFGKQQTRRQLVAEAARAAGVTCLYSNLVGNEAGRLVYDGHLIIQHGEETVAENTPFGFAPCQVIHAAVNIDTLRTTRLQNQSGPMPTEPDPGLVAHTFDWQQPKTKNKATTPPTNTKQPVLAVACPHNPWQKESAFAHAIALGLYDHARKAKAKGFIVSLSGGADSAAAVCLVRLMVDLAVDQLGVETVCKDLGLACPDMQTNTASNTPSKTDITKQVLTTAYQATAQSSDTTQHAAQTLADALGARHHVFDIQPMVDQCLGMVEASWDRPLNWQQDDIALQNIQARLRAPAVWLLANLENKILLTTSNRSEAAVGYATMDGDTCGGLAPLAGIDKAFLRHWLVWLETTGDPTIAPIPALAAINRQKPTAELRPADQNQTDEQDLMPYDVLDTLEHAVIGNKQSPADALQTVTNRFPGHNQPQLLAWTQRFLTLWSNNQWKRERYAPGLHVDDKSLDPKTWCRFPILSGGFRLEQSQLQPSPTKQQT